MNEWNYTTRRTFCVVGLLHHWRISASSFVYNFILLHVKHLHIETLTDMTMFKICSVSSYNYNKLVSNQLCWFLLTNVRYFLLYGLSTTNWLLFVSFGLNSITINSILLVYCFQSIFQGIIIKFLWFFSIITFRLYNMYNTILFNFLKFIILALMGIWPIVAITLCHFKPWFSVINMKVTSFCHWCH